MERTSCAASRGRRRRSPARRRWRRSLPEWPEVRSQLAQLAAALQRFPLEQPDEVRMATDEVEVLADGAGQHDVGRLAALERALPTALHGVAHLAERALEHGAVELGLAAEEVGRRAAGDAGGGPDLLQAGALVALRANSRSAASRMVSRLRVASLRRSGGSSHSSPCCLLISKLCMSPAPARTSGRHGSRWTEVYLMSTCQTRLTTWGVGDAVVARHPDMCATNCAAEGRYKRRLK